MIRQMFSHSRRGGAKEKRLAEKKLHEQDRRNKLDRTRHGEAHDDVKMANNLRPFGVDYLNTSKDQVIPLVRILTEGKPADRYPKQALDFLQENFDMELVSNDYGVKFIHFPENPKQGEAMNLYSVLAEKSGETRKTCKAVMESLVNTVHKALKEERRVRIPEVGIIRITFRPERKAQKHVANPFRKGEFMNVKARAASNKIRFSATKSLKEYVDKKVDVVAPKKKKK